MLFISYSTKDQEITETIYAKLKENHLNPWIASKNILSSENYALKIAESIKESDGIVLILSTNSMESIHVEKEMGLALKYKKPIYPLKIDLTLPENSFEYYLEGVQWIDATVGFDHAMTQYIQQLSKHSDSSTSVNTLTANVSDKPVGFKVVNRPENIEKYLIDAIKIDQQYYSNELSGVLDTCVNWYNANNDIYTFVVDGEEKVVGYINMMPVELEIYEKIKNGHFLDNDIPSSSVIDPFMPGTYYLYFCSVAIDQSMKPAKRQIFKMLYESFFKKLDSWAEDGICIQAMISDAVTADGKSIAESFGMQKVGESDHESSIYTATLLPPVFKVNDPLSKKVLEKYRQYYEHYVL